MLNKGPGVRTIYTKSVREESSMETVPTLECAPDVGGDKILPTSRFSRSRQKSDKVVLFYASSCTVGSRTYSPHVSTGDETDDETFSQDRDEGYAYAAGDEEPDNLVFSNWKRLCDYRRSTSDAKLPKYRSLATHAKAKDERRRGNVGQNLINHKENVETKLAKLGLARTGTSLYQRRNDGTNGCSATTNRLERRKGRWPSDGTRNPSSQTDHPAALRHALQQDKLPTGADEVIKLLAAAQFRDLTPEDYEMLLTLDQSVKPKTVSKAILSSIEAVEANAKGCVGDVCSVCMDPICGTQRVKTLPCNHTFHAPCIDQWLANCSRNCPLDGLAFD